MLLKSCQFFNRHLPNVRWSAKKFFLWKSAIFHSIKPPFDAEVAEKFLNGIYWICALGLSNVYRRVICQRVLTTKPLEDRDFEGCTLGLHILSSYFFKENKWFNFAVFFIYNSFQKIFPAYMANILTPLRATLEQFSIPFNKLPFHGALQTSNVTSAFIQKGLTYRYNIEETIKEIWSFKSTLL